MYYFVRGADHHGYIGRMMAMCASYGDIPHENLEIIIGQMVNCFQVVNLCVCLNVQELLFLDDLVDAVGVDAARYSL